MKAAIGLAPLFLAGVAFGQQTTQQVTQYSLPSDKLAKATALYDIHVRLFALGLVYGFVILLVFLFAKVGPKFRDFAERVSSRHFLQSIIFIPLLLISIDLLELPLRIYRHHLGLAYGLSVQAWGSWLWDVAKGEMITLLVYTMAISGLYAAVRKSPRRWWFSFWVVALPFIVFFVFLAPLLIDPLFNHFEPLEAKQPALVEAIEQVVQRVGLEIPRSRMFEMRASEKTTELNAYVTGIGTSKRVVVWDTTEKAMTVPQTLFVFGHEMGHYVLHHIWKGMAFFATLRMIALYAGYHAIGAVLRRWGPRWGIRNVGDWASLPVFLLLFAIFNFALEPVSNAYSRHLEHEADRYGLEVIHGFVPSSPQAAAQSFQLLGERSLDYPYPNRWLVFWTYSHPDIGDRVRFSLEYRPWERGEPPKYVKSSQK